MTISNGWLEEYASAVNGASPPTIRLDEDLDLKEPTETDQRRKRAELRNDEVEETVAVDRKKLEFMIQTAAAFDDEDATFSGYATSADKFFSEIMQQTRTRIFWPSKLKIGAKTKKDPHVKILGLPEHVACARELILSTLKAKQNRVTLKIDVPYTDHSHIIGRHGQNAQGVMRRTTCHVHFPDTNRDPDKEKVNQVGISGFLPRAEEARAEVRLKRKYGSVHLTLRTSPRNDTPSRIIIRGSVCDEDQIRSATIEALQALKQRLDTPVTFSVEILGGQQAFVRGDRDCNIDKISNLTGVQFRCPRTNPRSSTDTTFSISGQVDAVLAARRYLLGCMPLSLVFDYRDDLANKDFDGVAERFGIAVARRQKKLNPELPYSGSPEIVSITVPECRASVAYAAYTSIVGDEQLVECKEYEFMRPFFDTPQAMPPYRQPIVPPVYMPVNYASAQQVMMGLGQLSLSPIGVVRPPMMYAVSTPMQFGPIVGTPSPSGDAQQAVSSFFYDSSPSQGYGSHSFMSPSAVVPTNSCTDSRTSSFDSSAANRSLTSSPPEATAVPAMTNGTSSKAVGAERRSLRDYEQAKLDAYRKRVEEQAKLHARRKKNAGMPERSASSQFTGYGFSTSMPAPALRTLAEKDAASPSIPSRPLADSAFVPEEYSCFTPAPSTNDESSFSKTSYLEFVKRQPQDDLSGSEDLVELLGKFNVLDIVHILEKNEIDLDAFLMLSERDLISIGVDTLHRQRARAAICAMRCRRSMTEKPRRGGWGDLTS